MNKDYDGKNVTNFVGKNIERIRSERNLTINQLSNLSNISETTILAAETGKLNLTIIELIYIASSLDVEVKELLYMN
ncbi:MAG: helix-turn-helix transcriptional regulator [Clostridia bacterium]